MSYVQYYIKLRIYKVKINIGKYKVNQIANNIRLVS